MRRGQLGSGAPRVGGESPGVGPPHKGVSMGQGPGRAVVSAMGGKDFSDCGSNTSTWLWQPTPLLCLWNGRLLGAQKSGRRGAGQRGEALRHQRSWSTLPW